MSSFVPFYDVRESVGGILSFFISDKVFEKLWMKDSGVDYEELLLEFSAKKSILFVKKSQESFYIYSNSFTFLCLSNSASYDMHNNISIADITRTRSGNHADMIRKGKLLGVENIHILRKAGEASFFDYLNGSVVSFKPDPSSLAMAYQTFLAYFRYSDEFYDEDSPVKSEEEEEYVPDENLDVLLDLAENYAVLEYELDNRKVIEKGKIQYTEVRPVKGENRRNRIAYEFKVEGIETFDVRSGTYVKQIDEKLFDEGSLVNVELKNGTFAAAEITKLYRKEEDYAISSMVLLFKEEDFDRRDLPEFGFIALSSSPVSRDVRLDAIDRIRKGTCKAKYLDLVLGQSEISEYGRIDEKLLATQMADEEHRPNMAQINAIRRGIASSDVFLVMGPPGTGKTTVIQEWVRYFAANNKKVLISSKNHKAVDNVLKKFTGSDEIEMIRIGSEEKVDPEMRDFLFDGKVEKKRQEILRHCEEQIGWIDGGAGNSGKLVQELETVRTFLHERRNKEGALKEKLRVLLQRKEDLYALSDHYDNVLAYLNELKQEIEERTLSYDDLQASERGILSPLIAIRLSLEKKKIISLCEDYELNRAEANQIAHAYNKEHDAYLADVYDFYEKEYLPLKQMTDKATDEMYDVCALLKNLPAEWNLSLPRDLDQTERRWLALEENLERLFKIREALQRWKEENRSQKNFALTEVVLENADVVGATCIGINSQRRFSSLDFDVSIIDEAGQIQIHDALVPMSICEKLIMVGDHMQIPPSADPEMLEALSVNHIDDSLYKMSLFERMYESFAAKPETREKAIAMLNTQYRIPSQIAATISRQFYQGRYVSGPDQEKIKGVMKELGYRSYVAIDTDGERDRFESRSEKGRISNNLEAEICATIVKKLLLEDHFDPDQIGVISAYSEQVGLIREKLKAFAKDKLAVYQMAATLDSFQGQEREVILYSFTRCNHALSRHSRIGFLSELRRLNVAMSRGRRQLILIGDMRFLKDCEKMNDADGQEIYEGSEKKFSDFIMKMLEDVKKPDNNSLYLSYKEFREAMGE